MVAERKIKAEDVVAESVRFDDQDRAIVGQQVVRSAALDWALRDLSPREWEEIASYLFALIAREPVKSSPNYAGHRILLGYLAQELRTFAQSAGIPVGLEADLRAASTQAEEERIRLLIFERQLGRERYLDEIQKVEEMAHENAKAVARRAADEDTEDDHVPEEPEIDEEPAAAPAETEDDPDLSYL